jgi:hypothetical protein
MYSLFAMTTKEGLKAGDTLAHLTRAGVTGVYVGG